MAVTKRLRVCQARPLCRLRTFLLFAAVVLGAMSMTMRASAEPLLFSTSEFRAAQASGKPILVYVGASWCTTCSLQQSALADALAQIDRSAGLPDLVVFTVDFDAQKDVAASLNVGTQSTLVLFRGRTEIGRSLGETDVAAIKAFITQSRVFESGQREAAEKLFAAASYVLSFLAGILSILSPCVLPLLPLLFASAVGAHRFGALSLAAGIALSYAVTGLFVATIGFGIGLNGDVFRAAGASLMAIFGLALLIDHVPQAVAAAEAGFETTVNRFIARLHPAGIRGQFAIGALLGALWSPCVGPTLAAAVTLAAQRRALWQVALAMFLFGLGAALPLVIIGALSRAALMRWERKLSVTEHLGKLFLGLVMLVLAVAILSGIDRQMETYLLQIWPEWLARLAIRA